MDLLSATLVKHCPIVLLLDSLDHGIPLTMPKLGAQTWLISRVPQEALFVLSKKIFFLQLKTFSELMHICF